MYKKLILVAVALFIIMMGFDAKAFLSLALAAVMIYLYFIPEKIKGDAIQNKKTFGIIQTVGAAVFLIWTLSHSPYSGSIPPEERLRGLFFFVYLAASVGSIVLGLINTITGVVSQKVSGNSAS